MKSLKGMSILVTGGGSGIGFGTARYCICLLYTSDAADE